MAVGVGHAPLNTSTYVVAAFKFVPDTVTVIVALDEVAVNWYHLPNVVAAVAPPHEPVGAELTAENRSSLVSVQLVDIVSAPGDEQVACARTKDGLALNKRKRITPRVWMLVLMNRIDLAIKGFG